GSTRNRGSLEAALEGQADHGQPVLCLVWHHDAIFGRRGRTPFYETAKRTRHLTPTRTTSHDATGGRRGIRYGGGEQPQHRADVEQTKGAPGVFAPSTPTP